MFKIKDYQTAAYLDDGDSKDGIPRIGDKIVGLRDQELNVYDVREVAWDLAKKRVDVYVSLNRLV